MKVYITKYALTQGILQMDMEQSQHCPSMVTKGHQAFHGDGRDWHRTRESAVTKANAMRLKKIETVKKQLQNLSTPFE